MGTKTAVAFSVIFMAGLEKRLLMASPSKPLVWKRFINDIFSLWNISMQEVSNFVNFANTFHPTIKFTCEMSSQRAVFLDTEVFKGPRLSTHKILDLQTHFKPTETFQYTHFSSCHPLNCKKGFIKGGALRLLRTNSVRENFVKNKRDFEHRLCKRGYPLTLVQEILTDVKFTDRKKDLCNKQHKQKRFYRLLLPTIRPHRISTERFSWNTGTSFSSNLSYKTSLTSHRLYRTGRKNPSRTSLSARKFLQSRKQSQNKRSGLKSKLEDNLHTITLTDS